MTSPLLERGRRRLCLLAGLLLAVPSLTVRAQAQHEGHAPAANPDPAADRPVVFLDKSPRIVAYQLGRLSNARLLRVERDTSDAKFAPVYEAILGRAGMEPKHRVEAASALAKLRRTDAAGELIAAIKRADNEAAAPAIPDLARLLLDRPAPVLRSHQSELEGLAAEAAQPGQRGPAFAALVSIAPPEVVWAWAEQKQALAALLAGLPLQPEASRRAAFASRIEPLLRPGGDPSTLRGAIAAAAALPGREAPVFAALAQLFAAGAERPAVVRAIQQVPKDRWPADQLMALAEALIDYAAKAPETERIEANYLDTLQLGKDLAARLPREQGVKVRQALAAAGVNIIRLRTLPEQMYFDQTLIPVEAGKPVAIIFENPDAMQHNLVLTAPGALEEIGQASEKMPPTPDAEGRLYVPSSPKVLHATRLLNRGEQAVLRFTAPARPDRYPYVCTFPGHWLRMRGTLLVVEDLEAYLAQAPAVAAPTITEWKLEDLAAGLPAGLSGRDPQRGQEVFVTAGCVACHQVGSLGAVYGPNLGGVFAKYQNDPRTVLGEMLEPSRNIDPRYRACNLNLANGDSLTGFILREDAESVTIQTGAAESLIQQVPKKDIQSREPQESSVMPGGLLNLLSKEQILDLLAFLAAARP